MSIGGTKRAEQSFENAPFKRRVGLFEARVIAINPDMEEFKTELNMDVKEDSKQLQYLDADNKKLRIDVWFEEVNNRESKMKATFFIEEKPMVKRDGTKQQYINAVGQCTWSDSAENLPAWFTKKEYRQAYAGEEDLYNFLRVWLGQLDLRLDDAVLQLNWKSLMKGNVSELKAQINGEYCNTVLALATVITKEKDGETKEFQGIYSKAFLPAYNAKQFKLNNYDDPRKVEELRQKLKTDAKNVKPFERFVVQLNGEYGCKDFFTLKDIRDYNPGENLVASDAVIADDDSEF